MNETIDAKKVSIQTLARVGTMGVDDLVALLKHAAEFDACDDLDKTVMLQTANSLSVINDVINSAVKMLNAAARAEGSTESLFLGEAILPTCAVDLEAVLEGEDVLDG